MSLLRSDSAMNMEAIFELFPELVSESGGNYSTED